MSTDLIVKSIGSSARDTAAVMDRIAVISNFFMVLSLLIKLINVTVISYPGW